MFFILLLSCHFSQSKLFLLIYTDLCTFSIVSSSLLIPSTWCGNPTTQTMWFGVTSTTQDAL